MQGESVNALAGHSAVRKSDDQGDMERWLVEAVVVEVAAVVVECFAVVGGEDYECLLSQAQLVHAPQNALDPGGFVGESAVVLGDRVAGVLDSGRHPG